jgi:alanyl aminopeptidase
MSPARIIAVALMAAITVSCSHPRHPLASHPLTSAPAPLLVEPAPIGTLPTDVHPLGESIALDLDPARDRFNGSVEIALRLDRPRRVLWLHGRGLTVGSTSLVTAEGDTLTASWQEVDPSGVARVVLPRPVGPGEATLHVHFNAAFDRQLVGLYRVKDAIFSKFEATYARRAFPGFDEPAFKAPFDVTLTVPVGDQAIGNMPVVENAPLAANRRRVRFARTPPLPTYLVAVAVGPFATSAQTMPPAGMRAQPLPIAVVALSGRIAGAAFALGLAPAFVAEQERYFGIPFPFPKLDLIAVPDFPTAAVENAGAIGFRDSVLLLDDKTAPLRQRTTVASTLAHELAHQWFGDLVTMRWWDDLWLSESFASFFSRRTLRAVEPAFEVDLDTVHDTNAAMNGDGLATTRRIRQPIESPDDITNAFDTITYRKGEAVLTMLEHWIGAEPFRRGIQRYLTAHAWGNGTTDDLIADLSREAGRDLAPVVASFLDQPGAPAVKARLTCREGRGRLELEQSRWLPVGSAASADLSWKIPVCVRAGINGRVESTCTLLDKPAGALELPGCADWVMPNADAAGYYRFTLGPADLARLRAVAATQLSPAERMVLVYNLDAAFRSAALPAADVLRAVDAMALDGHGAAVTAALELVAFVSDFMLDEADKHRFAAHLAHRYAPLVAALGWRSAPSDSRWRRQLRAQLLALLALQIEVPAVLDQAARLGRAYLGLDGDGKLRSDVVDADLAEVALAAAARRGDARVQVELERQLFAAGDGDVRRRLLSAIANTRDPALVQRALDLALDTRLRNNERLATLRPLFESVATRDRAWEWLEAHFDALAALLPDRYAGAIPKLPRICDSARADRVRAFFGPRVATLTGGPRILAQALEDAANCASLAGAQRRSTRDFIRTLEQRER